MHDQVDIRTAVLDVLAYFAVWRWPIRETEIYELIPVRTNQLAVRDTLKVLAEENVITQSAGLIRLKSKKYLNRVTQETEQAKYLKKARNWSRLFGLLPFVRAVLVVNSASFGVVHKNSDIDLMIITDPNRIYLTKGILMYGLKFLGQLETKDKKAMRFSLGMFLTTNGVNMQRDMMKINEPHLWYWLMAAKPVWGADVWHDLLKRNADVTRHFPNHIWPRTDVRIPGASWRTLDNLDNYGYRRHLRHTAAQPKNQAEQAFVRIRPDIINLHANSGSELGRIIERYKKIRAKLA